MVDKVKVFSVLSSDRLPATFRFWATAECVQQSIKIMNGNRHCPITGDRDLHCIMIGRRAERLNFGTARLFREKTGSDFFLNHRLRGQLPR